MLKNQDANTDPQPSVSREAVSQARVTPQELTEALAAIESRKQAEASRLAGTIPIGDAISDLHLDSTPEDIWAEVQAQRAKAEAAQAEASAAASAAEQKAQRRTEVTVQVRQQSVTPRRGWRKSGVIGMVLVGWLVFHNAFGSHSGGYVPSHAVPSHAAPILRPLSGIPDGQEVYADDSALAQVSEGKPLPQITVSGNESGNRWKVFRRSGHVYLRGYIESADSLQPLQGKPLNVYNDDDSGELHDDQTSNITLRVDGVPLQKSGGDGDFSGITVTNFQPDPLTTLSPWH